MQDYQVRRKAKLNQNLRRGGWDFREQVERVPQAAATATADDLEVTWSKRAATRGSPGKVMASVSVRLERGEPRTSDKGVAKKLVLRIRKELREGEEDSPLRSINVSKASD